MHLKIIFFFPEQTHTVQHLLYKVLLSKHIASSPSISYGLGHF